MRTKVWCVAAMILAGAGLAWPPLRAEMTNEFSPAMDKGTESARKQVQMLDTLYKNAVVSVTGRYVKQQDTQPAAMVAKDVFAAMEKAGFHKARLVDASGAPQNKDNVAKTEFEKLAVAAMKEGKPYFERVIEKDGKPVLQAATIVPAVMKQCADCHGVKEGQLLGTIVYELKIEQP